MLWYWPNRHKNFRTLKVNEYARRLEASGIGNSFQEAVWLMAGVLGVGNSDIFARSDFSADELSVIEEAVSRREKGEPLQYILGEADFFGRDFRAGPGVLIPRRDTEALIKAVKSIMKREEAFMFIDWGTGSGCIALTLLLEFPNSFAYMIESESDAARYAMFNTKRYELEARAVIASSAGSLSGEGAPHNEAMMSSFMAGQSAGACELNGEIASSFANSLTDERMPPSFTASQQARVCGLNREIALSFMAVPPQVDIIISNPPYIPANEIPHLMPSVRDYEPHSALNGGEDGMKYYRLITSQAVSLLKNNGYLVFEAGNEAQKEAIKNISSEFIYERGFYDEGGFERCIVLRKVGRVKHS